MSITDRQFIIYACPVGELNNQIETYFARSKELYGENKAHKYMPHCTLTGFFTDDLSSMNFYLQALDKAYLETKKNNSLDVKIQKITFSENWHGIELEANNLKQSIVNFTQLEKSPTRQEEIRLKDWLHLSLAYGFNPDRAEELKKLARETIDLKANVNWELRFYQKNVDWTWKCLKTWNLD